MSSLSRINSTGQANVPEQLSAQVISDQPTITCELSLQVPLLDQLRQATQKSHRQIEQNSRLARLLTPDLTISEYCETLSRLYGFYAPLEARLLALTSWEPPGLSLTERCCKSQWLRADLRYLGLSDHEVTQLPKAQELPEVLTPAAVLGCLYVLEGATLGGRIISKHLTASLGVVVEGGGMFYQGYGAASGKQWADFRRITEQCGWSLHETADALQAAVETFQCLDEWLS